MSKHSINLHGPWKWKFDEETQRVKFPCSIRLGSAAELSRVFHCPTSLTADQIVALTFEFHIVPATILLNDQVIGSDPPAEIAIEITPLLHLTNQIKLQFREVTISTGETPQPVFKAAALQIRDL